MTTYYLIRHGNKLPLSGDPGLSEIGIEQAKRTGAHFVKHHTVHHMYVSPLLRTQETAKHIAEAIGFSNIKLHNSLRERMNWGDDPSVSFEQFIEEWNMSSVNRDYQPKIGDSSMQAGERMKKLLEELHQKHPNTHIVIVSHGGVIMDTLRTIFGDEYIRQLNQDFTKKGIRECAITKIVFSNGKWDLEQFDSIGHWMY